MGEFKHVSGKEGGNVLQARLARRVGFQGQFPGHRANDRLGILQSGPCDAAIDRHVDVMFGHVRPQCLHHCDRFGETNVGMSGRQEVAPLLQGRSAAKVSPLDMLLFSLIEPIDAGHRDSEEIAVDGVDRLLRIEIGEAVRMEDARELFDH